MSLPWHEGEVKAKVSFGRFAALTVLLLGASWGLGLGVAPPPTWRFAMGTLWPVEGSIYQDGDYYLDDGGRLAALLYSGTVDLADYLGHRVVVGGSYHMTLVAPEVPVITVSTIIDLEPQTPTPVAAAPRLGNIKGAVFNDLDGDGSRDEGEPPIAGIRLRIESAGWNHSTASAEDGTYEFCCLTKSTYLITADIPADWVTTRLLPLEVSIDGNDVLHLNIGLAVLLATPTPTPEAPLGFPKTGTPPPAPLLNPDLDLALWLGVAARAASLWRWRGRTGP